MIIAVDETGDANLGIATPRFAVGALYLEDQREADRIVETARQNLGDPTRVFHYSEESTTAQQALSDAIDASLLAFHFRVIGYAQQIPDKHRSASQTGNHIRLLGHALNLLPFLPTGSIQLSAREASLTNRNLDALITEINRDREAGWPVLNARELRFNPEEISQRIRIEPGTNSSALQICDHLLGRWQSSNRGQTPAWLPRGSMRIEATNTLGYFTLAQIFRGDCSALSIAQNYSRERLAAGGDIERPPLIAAYIGLHAAGEDHWSESDDELNRLLLNEQEDVLYAQDGTMAHLCFLILDGRTRWRERVAISQNDFSRYAIMASAFLRGETGNLDITIINSIRWDIGNFRAKLRSASSQVADPSR